MPKRQALCGVSSGRTSVSDLTLEWSQFCGPSYIFAFAQVNVFAKAKSAGKSTERQMWWMKMESVDLLLSFSLKKKSCTGPAEWHVG